MWEVREKFGLAYADVGRAFGDRDQSTAMSAIKVHETCEASERNSKKQPLWNK
jgi:chromosomal replication initiation ATPase DnaA